MNKSLSIVLTGEAGQGLQTVELFFIKAASRSYHVFSSSEFMSRIRGGHNSVEIRVSSEPVQAFVKRIDLLIALDPKGLSRLKDRISPDTVVIGDEELSGQDQTLFSYKALPLSEMAKKSGGSMYTNIIVFGILAGILDLNSDICMEIIRDRFAEKGEAVIDSNIKAFETGHLRGYSLALQLSPEPISDGHEYIIKNGTEAVSIGALAGGCDFIASYPMSPATGVLQYLAAHADDFGIALEQAEDEIAACNMTIGAWYGGARALATTSGGGFALMEEGISLSGITETPCVIHLAQRPGPATGLPTRTEQGDLMLAVYAGHGEFPRIVLTPGTIEDAMLLSQKAFHLADLYQVPVFILSDQYLLDSHFMIKPVTFERSYLRRSIVESTAHYQRYALTRTGISPRSIPGYGEGLVCCDSDEHDESGHITEDFSTRNTMNEKRLKKTEAILTETGCSALIGPVEYKNLVVGWGSTYGAITEALKLLGRDDTAYLYVKQAFPLTENIRKQCLKAERIICVENNATGQFALLLKSYLDITVSESILQYNGLPFAVEDLTEKLQEVL